MALIFNSLNENDNNNSNVSFLYVYRNSVVSAERYQELMQNAVPQSCFVDVYAAYTDDSEISVESLVSVPVKKTMFTKHKSEPVVQIQTRIKLVKDKMKLIECENSKYKRMKQIKENEQYKLDSKLTPLQHYRIAQIKAEEMRLYNPAARFVNMNSTSSKSGGLDLDTLDTLYTKENVANDYDYLLMFQG